MKKIFKNLLFVLILMMGVLFITGCDKKESSEAIKDQETIDKEAAALDEKYENVKKDVEAALQAKFEEIYGDNVVDARIYVGNIYTSEYDELKDYNLTENDYGFEVSYELKPSESANINELLIPNGEYDEETGWVTDLKRVGIIRYNDDKYEITDFGSAF